MRGKYHLLAGRGAVPVHGVVLALVDDHGAHRALQLGHGAAHRRARTRLK